MNVSLQTSAKKLTIQYIGFSILIATECKTDGNFLHSKLQCIIHTLSFGIAKMQNTVQICTCREKKKEEVDTVVEMKETRLKTSNYEDSGSECRIIVFFSAGLGAGNRWFLVFAIWYAEDTLKHKSLAVRCLSWSF